MIKIKTTILSSAILFAAAGAYAGNLTFDVYNPGAKSIFAVTSTVIYGDKEAVLVDAQFQKNDAQELADKIKKSGKKLTTIFISHSDPDYYFGLDTLTKNFPQVKVLATPQTIYAIENTMDEKMSIWGPQLKENAPAKLIVPTAYTKDNFEIEGNKIIIKQSRKDPDHIYLWAPKQKTILGGVSVLSGEYVWTADSQSKEDRQNWVALLSEMQNLKPTKVIPGHFEGKNAKTFTVDSVTFTKKYLQNYEAVLDSSKDSKEVVSKMAKLYPAFKGIDSLALSAKVNKGEMKWTAVKSYPAIGRKVQVN